MIDVIKTIIRWSDLSKQRVTKKKRSSCRLDTLITAVANEIIAYRVLVVVVPAGSFYSCLIPPPSFGCFDHLFQVLSYCKLVNSTTTDNRFELKEKVNKLNLKTLDDNFVRDCFFFSYLIQCSIKN